MGKKKKQKRLVLLFSLEGPEDLGRYGFSLPVLSDDRCVLMGWPRCSITSGLSLLPSASHSFSSNNIHGKVGCVVCWDCLRRVEFDTCDCNDCELSSGQQWSGEDRSPTQCQSNQESIINWQVPRTEIL